LHDAAVVGVSGIVVVVSPTVLVVVTVSGTDVSLVSVVSVELLVELGSTVEPVSSVEELFGSVTSDECTPAGCGFTLRPADAAHADPPVSIAATVPNATTVRRLPSTIFPLRVRPARLFIGRNGARPVIALATTVSVRIPVTGRCCERCGRQRRRDSSVREL
jgi:hypothetical protein